MTMTTMFFQCSVLLLVFVVFYLHDNLFVCLLWYLLLVSIGARLGQHYHVGNEPHRGRLWPDLSKYCPGFNKCCVMGVWVTINCLARAGWHPLDGGTRVDLGKNQSYAKCVNMSSISGWPDPHRQCLCLFVCVSPFCFVVAKKGYA